MNRDEKISWITNLRTFACFLVVLLHVSVQNYDIIALNPISTNALSFRLYDSISRCSVPLFFMISGFLFLTYYNSDKIKKHVKKLFIVYILFSLFYALIYYHDKEMIFIVYSIIRGHYHLWFLPAIVALYIATPVIHSFVKDEKLLNYFLIVSFILGIFIPQVANFILKFDNYYLNYIGWAINDLLDNAGFQFFTGYTFYYLLGYKLGNGNIRSNYKIMLYVLTVFSLLFTFAFEQYDFLTLNTMIIAVFVFLMFRNKMDKRNILCEKLAKSSLGIYCLHIFVRDQLDTKLHINTLCFNGFFSVPVITILVFVICLIISMIFLFLENTMKKMITKNN